MLFMSLTYPTRTEQEHRHPCPSPRRSVASLELITTAALALSTAVAVTAVSIGIARAEVLGTVSKADTASFAVALFIGLLLSAVSAASALMAAHPRAE
jgi:hypothetical protein